MQLLSSMRASQRGQAQQNARWPASTNPMHARFTCVILQPLPARALRSELEGNPGGAKEHAGTRFVGYVLQGEPGWTSTGGPSTESGSSSKEKKKAASTAVRGEKLTRQAGEAILLHSYDLKNKGGSYFKDKRTENFAAIIPGMILTVRIFGDQLLKVLEKQDEDLHVFDIVSVELSMKSMQSSAQELKLDVKRLSPIPNGARLLCGWNRLPATVEQSSSRTITDLLPADLVANMDQQMIKGNLSQTVHLVNVPLVQTNGLFAMHADGHMRFHVQVSLSLCCLDFVYLSLIALSILALARV